MFLTFILGYCLEFHIGFFFRFSPDITFSGVTFFEARLCLGLNFLAENFLMIAHHAEASLACQSGLRGFAIELNRVILRPDALLSILQRQQRERMGKKEIN